MENKYKKCPYCLEKIQAEAIKCRYCEEWLDKEKASEKVEPSKSSTFKKIKSFLARLLLWSLVFFMWLIYAFETLDSSEEAIKLTGGIGPLPSGYSILLLGLIMTLLLKKTVFNKSKKIWNLTVKIFVLLIIVLGLVLQVGYDPTLKKLRDYYDNTSQVNFVPSNKPFTGDDLMNEANKYRSSKGLQTIQLDGDLCTNIFKPHEQAVELVYGRRTMGEGIFAPWFESELKEVKDNYNGMSGMVLSSSKPISDAISIWIDSPADRVNLEYEGFNAGCAYAKGGVGVLVMAEKK